MGAAGAVAAIGKQDRTARAGVAATMASALVLLFASNVSGQPPQGVLQPGDLKKLSLDELQAIEVMSVSRRREELSTAASSIQVITADDIRRAGATTLPEALRLASNLQVAQIDSHDWAITARGFNNVTANKLLVLIDGRVVYMPLHAGVYWDVQDTVLEDVAQIEVISGPGATLWGSNAVNGVINIITKTARDTQGALVTGSSGSELRGSVGIRYGAQINPDTHFRAYGKYFGRDSSQLPTGPQATDGWRMGQSGFRLDWHRAQVNHVTLQSDIYDGGLEQFGRNDGAVNGGNVLGRWSRTFSKDSDLSLQFYYDQNHRDIPGVLVEDLRTFDADFQHRFRVAGGHQIVWGLGSRVSDADQGNSAVVSIMPAHLSRRWFSGFVQDEVALGTDRVRLTLGTKVEHNDYTGVELQPSSRLAWTLSSRQMLWGAVSRAVRTPSQVDRGFFVALPGTRAVPDRRRDRISSRGAAGLRARLSEPAPRPGVDDRGGLLQRLRSPPQPGTAGAAGAVASRVRQRSARTVTRGGVDGGIPRHRLVADPVRLTRHSAFAFARVPGAWTGPSAASRRTIRVTTGRCGSRWICPRICNSTSASGMSGGSSIRPCRPTESWKSRLAWEMRPGLEWSIVGQNLLHAHHPEFHAPAMRREAERSVYGKFAWRF